MSAPVMTLPNGDVLREGDYGVTRGAWRVGPVVHTGIGPYRWSVPWPEGSFYYDDNGIGCREDPDDDIIAKAPNPRTLEAVAELDAKDDTPVLWRDMTPEEKGALLLADHEGEEIQHYSNEDRKWFPVHDDGPYWLYTVAYRRKPKPKVETVIMYAKDTAMWGWVSDSSKEGRTHRIILTIRDGKVDPVARVEKLT